MVQCADEAVGYDAVHGALEFEQTNPSGSRTLENNALHRGALVPDLMVELCRYLDYALVQARSINPRALQHGRAQ